LPVKTYNSAESIAEFFKLRNEHLGIRRKARRSGQLRSFRNDGSGDLVPGSYVRHAKYAAAWVLKARRRRRSTKLTVSFPAMPKEVGPEVANLEKA